MVLFLTSEVLSPLFLASIQPANSYSPIQQIFPERDGRTTSGIGKMIVCRLNHGTKSYGLKRNEIEEGMVRFFLSRGGRKGTRGLSSEQGMFGKQVESA
jgi:hypothetical protein